MTKEEILKNVTDNINELHKVRKEINNYFLSIVTAMFAAIIVLFSSVSFPSLWASICFYSAVVTCAISLICFTLAVVTPYFAIKEHLHNCATDLVKTQYSNFDRKRENKWNKANLLLKIGVWSFLISIICFIIFAGIYTFN